MINIYWKTINIHFYSKNIHRKKLKQKVPFKDLNEQISDEQVNAEVEWSNLSFCYVGYTMTAKGHRYAQLPFQDDYLSGYPQGSQMNQH